ncbi:MAG: TetR/AcrR family transcriptional regulator [Acidimicrobiales bacterium]|nr:TetR/AcrR family transcriptional regulator [Acidimicrobiales bacterium]
MALDIDKFVDSDVSGRVDKRRGRRSQPERTAVMQKRLLEATVESLVDVGWARTTLPEVVKRAGVARGAQVHHFPTKSSLIQAVGKHLISTSRRDFESYFQSLAPDEKSIQSALDGLWSMLKTPTWIAIMELGIASRTEESASAVIVDFIKNVDENIMEFVKLNFGELGKIDEVEMVLKVVIAFLSGLALERTIVANEDDKYDRVYKFFKSALISGMGSNLIENTKGEK